MGLTSENVAQRYGVTRQDQDQAAVSSTDHSRLCDFSMLTCYCVIVLTPYLFEQVDSHRKAAAARASGKFKDEIIPVTTKVNKTMNSQEARIPEYYCCCYHVF